MGNLRNLKEDIHRMKSKLDDKATNGTWENEEYKNLRTKLLNEPLVRDKLPIFLVSCRSLDEFWSFIKAECGNEDGIYDRRHKYIKEEFEPVEDYLKSLLKSPFDEELQGITEILSIPRIKEEWIKASERVYPDPEGAITISRSLLESVCKHILDNKGIEYSNKYSLSKLYRLVSENFDLAPEDQVSHEYKKIYGGCTTIIGSLESIRNSTSDAHGKGEQWESPSSIYAELSINIAGSISLFLLKKFEEDV